MNESAPMTGTQAPSSGQRWPEGWTKLHVYLTDLTEVKAVADSYRPVIDLAADKPVPHEWLHATVASVECDAAGIGDDVLRELVDRLREKAAGIPAFKLTVGPALAATGGVLLDTFPGTYFDALVDACVAAVDEVVEGDVGRPCGGPGHVSLSYRSDDLGVDRQRGAIQNKLRDVRPGRTEITVTGVDLVRVAQSEDASTYTWQHIDRIPLGE
ncbi:hypothetical protein LO763_20400 [Glycomyces sp. A-F 0318]|uniref:hypothetical protein n=1 Tax=Glycomyces amatae TaxID=2881355 RepID=UPI001E5B067C|nr:hypothetical protein [Glycomyces amatae]MCD0445976.1 hypothetical protein [Glycomyces amatae]